MEEVELSKDRAPLLASLTVLPMTPRTFPFTWNNWPMQTQILRRVSRTRQTFMLLISHLLPRKANAASWRRKSMKCVVVHPRDTVPASAPSQSSCRFTPREKTRRYKQEVFTKASLRLVGKRARVLAQWTLYYDHIKSAIHARTHALTQNCWHTTFLYTQSSLDPL